MPGVERIGASERQADGVDRDRVRLANSPERGQRGAARRHVVLGMDLEPRHRGTSRDHVGHVHRSQADADRRREHAGPQPCRGCRLPPTTFSQDPLGRYTQASPWALRLDVPAHEELAV